MSKFGMPLLTLALGALGATFASVTLQPTSPGTKETGNINISGNVVSGKVMAGLSSSSSIITGYSPLSTTTGVQGSARNFGVRGQSTATTGLAYGGYFDGASQNGYGAWVKNKDTVNTGIGLLAETDAPFGTAGAFRANHTFGEPTALSATIATHDDTAKAVFASGRSGYGIYSLAEQISGVAGFFRGQRYALYGESPTRTGIQGVTSEGDGYGVIGVAPTGGTGHALYAFGTIGATGTKSLMIDHPDDPENKYLYQFCTEGDTPQLQYRGSAVLDGSGGAVVHLPAYFDKINRDPICQLTAVGASMPGLYVAEEVKNNRFRIAGGKSGAKVYWTVIGIRNDKFVQKYGAKAEREKPDEYKGTYLSPQLYGQPAQKSQFYDEKVTAIPVPQTRERAASKRK